MLLHGEVSQSFGQKHASEFVYEGGCLSKGKELGWPLAADVVLETGAGRYFDNLDLLHWGQESVLLAV